MRGLWTRIGLGAAGVFLVGMMLLTAARQTKAAVRDAVRTAVARTERSRLRGVATTEGMPEIPFRLNGDIVGRVAAFTIRRDRPGEAAQFRLTVQVTGGEPSDLSRCVIVPEKESGFKLDDGFRCAGWSEQALEDIGSVRFEPWGVQRPLRASRRVADNLRDGDPFRVSGLLGGPVQVEAEGDDGGMVHVLAGEAGASIRVQGDDGQSLFRLLADSSGALLSIRDEQGRQVMRLEAGKGGFALQIDTAGVHH